MEFREFKLQLDNLLLGRAEPSGQKTIPLTCPTCERGFRAKANEHSARCLMIRYIQGDPTDSIVKKLERAAQVYPEIPTHSMIETEFWGQFSKLLSRLAEETKSLSDFQTTVRKYQTLIKVYSHGTCTIPALAVLSLK